MGRLSLTLSLSILLTPFLLPSARLHSQQQLPTITYEGFRNIRTNGNDSTWGQGLTHRYVNGELRFLTLAHWGIVHEFSLSGTALNSSSAITSTTATWNISSTGALNNFNGIWYEQSKNRLWVTSSEDYTATNHPAKVTIITLGTGGSVSVQKQFYLNVPAKRVYGGCNAVPSSLVSQLGGAYVCGWGGYTSLVEQGGGASIGPTMYAIPDPDTVSNGSTVSVRKILEAAPASQQRGVRKTIPVNYFDGGDPRQNPSTRPTSPPVSSGNWLSPNAQGLGWMTWGDSYYNTGVWIGTTYAAVASLCQGACWYQSSTLEFDGRQFELHLWNGSSLGSNLLERPASMTELNLPRGNTRLWNGNVTAGNIAGATYDATSGRLYLIGFPLGPDEFTGRLYSFTVQTSGGGSAPPADTTGPTVSLSAPANGATVSGTVTLSASASDNVGVSGVWFTVDGVTVGSEDTAAPYQVSWNSASVANGSHTIRALARDAAGNVTTSASRTVTVSNTTADTTAPTVSLTAPNNGATVNGVVQIAATASDNVGVTQVQFRVNGANIGTPDTSAPYSINWNTASAANGSYTLTAVARDAAGNTSTSAARTVVVNNQAAAPPPPPPPPPPSIPVPPTSGDTTPPSVSLTEPRNNRTVSGNVTISATASDDVGVVSVQFTVDGENLGAPRTFEPYTITWNTATLPNGSHQIRAVARDAAGNVRTSSSRTVFVSNNSNARAEAGRRVRGDFDGDGTPDLLFQHTNGQLYSWFMQSHRISGESSLTPGAVNPVWQIAGIGDFNRDGGSDLLWQNQSTGQPYLWFLNGIRMVGESGIGSVPAGWKIATVGDLNGDGSPDIILQHSSGQIMAWLMNGTTRLQEGALGPGSVQAGWTPGGTADFNDDGRDDIVWQNRLTGALMVWYMNGRSVIRTEPLNPSVVNPTWVLKTVADFDRDGSPDLIWQHALTGQLYVWYLNGTRMVRSDYLRPSQVNRAWQIVGGGR